ncbi:MAG TPA: isoleucine--tRNA ligase [Candidatus Saccharimonadales bacterium]|nr:isoleucine--tRNA ligase [Candidatus Saccharimonadales bacterium]
MKFQAGQRRKAIEYEKDLVKYWKEHKTFEKSVEQRPVENSYVFYDGPPFITGVPHHGTLLSSIVKDAVPRYWAMHGKRVERVWGWDCHGLPAEVFTEKKLGIQDRRDIGTKISLEEYILTCRENMVQTGNLWEDTIDRIGRWVDFRGAYRTMDKDYMESVWWAFKQLFEAGKIYEGEKVLLYCTRDATPLSKAEVTMDAGSYQDVNDPSVFVKFKLTDEDAYLLAWTTTPWTLPANTAVAVNKDEDYSQVQLEDGTNVILATELLEKVLTDEKHNVVPFTFVKAWKGSELVGKSYEPLFADRGINAHKVWHADYVSMEEGTGIVHLAPAYGEEDYALSKENNFPFVSIIDENGFYTEGDWKGQNVWEANKPIAKELHARGVVWKIEYVIHSYPHCYRCGTRLMYRAHPSWFMDIQGQKQLMLEQNENVNWFPHHLKEGRFKKNIEQAPDWNLSRDRFWATAMPVWKSDDGDVKVVGSYAELKELSGVELEDYHRPWIDDVEFDYQGKHYKRIDKVMDCWFESGSMPFAQFHYPFENKERFESSFPGDFIVEYIGQVRAWFYYVHAVNVGLHGTNAYKQVITTGTVLGNDGRKLSKSLGNYTDPNEVMDLYSADALRFTLLNSVLLKGEDVTLKDKDVQDVQRKLAMIWNMYDFFTTYAAVDKWEWQGSHDDPSKELTNPLDVWVVSRLHQLQAHLEQNMDAYDIPTALEAVLPFLDDASNWYVRRSRRRFWKSGDDADKQAAYTTLHYVLLRLSLILAPFIPFLAEELFLKLTGGEMGESVHLLDWPVGGVVDEQAVGDMAKVREAINQGLSLRAAAGIKVRQPLAKVTLFGLPDLSSELTDIVKEELNVKAVELVPRGPEVKPEQTFAEVREAKQGTYDLLDIRVELDTVITEDLRREGMMREIVRHVQQSRKDAGLQVDDRIELHLFTADDELKAAITEHAETIVAETLAVSLSQADDSVTDAYAATVKVEGAELAVALKKVS